MRAIWKGAVSFGLVSIPVKLFTAVEKKDIKFSYLHEKCRAPVKYKKICSVCGKEVAYEDIIRGYEYEKGRYVIFSKEELERFPDGRSRTIDILDFVDLKEIDPVYFDKTYYLAPGETGEKPYLLLRRTMEETNKIAVARVVIRTREVLAALRVYKNILAMETMHFPDEVRKTELVPFEDRGLNIHDNELKMARQLVENLAAGFDPERYRDEYREKLLEAIQAKVAGEEIEVPEAAEKAKIIDLMEALRASVEMTGEQKDENKKVAAAGQGKKGRRSRKKKEKAEVG